MSAAWQGQVDSALHTSASSSAKWSIIVSMPWTLKRIIYNVRSAHMMLAIVRVAYPTSSPVFFSFFLQSLLCFVLLLSFRLLANKLSQAVLNSRTILVAWPWFLWFFFSHKSAPFLWILPSQFSVLASFCFTNSKMCFFLGGMSLYVGKRQLESLISIS